MKLKKEPTCQCAFDSWLGKIPHVVEQLSPGTTTTQPASEPVSHNR